MVLLMKQKYYGYADYIIFILYTSCDVEKLVEERVDESKMMNWKSDIWGVHAKTPLSQFPPLSWGEGESQIRIYYGTFLSSCTGPGHWALSTYVIGWIVSGLQNTLVTTEMFQVLSKSCFSEGFFLQKSFFQTLFPWLITSTNLLFLLDFVKSDEVASKKIGLSKFINYF